jgi:hypothetical protein
MGRLKRNRRLKSHVKYLFKIPHELKRLIWEYLRPTLGRCWKPYLNKLKKGKVMHTITTKRIVDVQFKTNEFELQQCFTFQGVNDRQSKNHAFNTNSFWINSSVFVLEYALFSENNEPKMTMGMCFWQAPWHLLPQQEHDQARTIFLQQSLPKNLPWSGKCDFTYSRRHVAPCIIENQMFVFIDPISFEWTCIHLTFSPLCNITSSNFSIERGKIKQTKELQIYSNTAYRHFEYHNNDNGLSTLTLIMTDYIAPQNGLWHA